MLLELDRTVGEGLPSLMRSDGPRCVFCFFDHIDDPLGVPIASGGSTGCVLHGRPPGMGLKSCSLNE